MSTFDRVVLGFWRIAEVALLAAGGVLVFAGHDPTGYWLLAIYCAVQVVQARQEAR